jgi:hypothetical protein
MFNPFSARRTKAPVVLDVHLNSRLQPQHRGDVFEDPLDQLLAKHAPGSEVIGGGTEFDPERGPLSCDSEVRLSGDPEETTRRVIDILEFLGAPTGSWARLGDGEPIRFGTWHGLSLALDGTTLPDEVYDQNSTQDLVDRIDAALPEDAERHSSWAGPAWTYLYYYGRDLEALRAAIESVTSVHPLAANHVIEKIT